MVTDAAQGWGAWHPEKGYADPVEPDDPIAWLSLDAAAHSVTLDSGKICQCGTTVDLGAFKTGDKVSMSFADKNGTSECCEMHIAA